MNKGDTPLMYSEMSTLVIHKKPFMYKLWAKFFRFIRDCNKIVSYESFNKRVIEAKKLDGECLSKQEVNR